MTEETMTEEIMTDKPDHGGWEPWEPEAGAAREVWDAFWAAMPSNDQDVPDGDTEEVNRLLTANPHLAREMPLLGELIWDYSLAFPDHWMWEGDSVLRRMAEVLVAHGCDLEQRRHEGITPLMIAAARGNEAMVEFLIARGSILTARDDYGQNVLHFAADSRSLDMIERCLETGLDPNLADDEGRTPLHILFDGTYSSCPDLVSFLLSRGASVNARDDQGRTVLHLLAQDSHYDLESLRLLIGAGADPFAVAEDGSTPWSIASGNEDETFCAVVREAAHAGDLGALAIFESEALDLIRRGQAGYYSFFASTPRPHSEKLCVYAEGQWFLLPPSVATLVRAEPAASLADEGFCKIQFHGTSHPVSAMVRRETDRFGPGPNFTRECAEFVARMLRFQNTMRGVGGGLA